MTGDEWEGRLDLVLALDHQDVGEVAPDRSGLDEDLAGARLRVGHVHVLELRRLAPPGCHHGLHCRSMIPAAWRRSTHRRREARRSSCGGRTRGRGRAARLTVSRATGAGLTGPTGIRGVGRGADDSWTVNFSRLVGDVVRAPVRRRAPAGVFSAGSSGMRAVPPGRQPREWPRPFPPESARVAATPTPCHRGRRSVALQDGAAGSRGPSDTCPRTLRVQLGPPTRRRRRSSWL